MNDVEEIKNRLDIVEVIAGYVPLKQAGSNWKGLSPFKTEKTPSFMVSSEKGIWHDFSTNQGGDVFSFVMQIEGIDFREALELLAKKAGVELKQRSPHDQQKSQSKSKIYDALEDAMKYYHLSLSRHQVALEYLTDKRNLSRETIKKYRLGYAPEGWQNLSDYLTARGYSHKDLIDAGLARQKTGRNTIYDVFRDRVMFPVFDAQGRVVGFSARILANQEADQVDVAKYINTPDSAVYSKGRVLYGLMQAKESIRKLDEVVLVEGNVDVLAPANAGYSNVVASSGTALTFDQLRALSRLTKNIKLCFDQDEAGIKATQRAIELSRDLDIKLMVVSYSDTGAKDPDELIAREPKAWEAAVKDAQYAPDYIFAVAEQRFDISGAHGKRQFAAFVLPTIAHLADDIEKQHYIKKLAQLLDVDEKILHNKLEQGLSKKPVTVVSPAKLTGSETPDMPKTKRQLTQAEKIERVLLELMLSNMAARDGLGDIEYDNISELHVPIFDALRKHPKLDVISLAKRLPKYSDYVKILSLRGEHVYSGETEHDARLEAFTQIHRLQKIAREKTKRQLTREITQAEKAGRSTDVAQLLRRYQALLNEG